jgi:hypothetical protein
MNIKKSIKDYFSILKEEDLDILISILKDDSKISTPFEGTLFGKESIKNFIIRLKDWLKNKNADIKILNSIDTDNRIIIEFVINLNIDDKSVELPAVVVIEIEKNLVNNIRIYHSSFPLTGKHGIIKPVLKPVDNLEIPEVIMRYMKAINDADKGLVLSLFEDDAYVQEPSGSKYRHKGKTGLKDFYEYALNSGGIPLQHCTATFDGKHFAVEYVFDQWGNLKFKPQAGIAIYEISNTDKIAAVRIYDDASPPTKS